MKDRIKLWFLENGEEVVIYTSGFIAGFLVKAILAKRKQPYSVWTSVDTDTGEMLGYKVILRDGTILPFHVPINSDAQNLQLT